MKVYGTRNADALCFPSSPPDDGSAVNPDRIPEPRANESVCITTDQKKCRPCLLAETAQMILLFVRSRLDKYEDCFCQF